MATVEQVVQAINDGALGSDFAATVHAGGDIHGKIKVSDVGHRHPKACGYVVVEAGVIDCSPLTIKAGSAKALVWIEQQIAA